MRHSIKTEILQQVLNYLATRPYNEVVALVQSIQADALPIAEVGSATPKEAEVVNE